MVYIVGGPWASFYQPTGFCYLERRRRRSMRTVTVIVMAMTIVAVIPKVINTIKVTSFPSSVGRAWKPSRPGPVLDVETPQVQPSGNQMLTR